MSGYSTVAYLYKGEEFFRSHVNLALGFPFRVNSAVADDTLGSATLFMGTTSIQFNCCDQTDIHA